MRPVKNRSPGGKNGKRCGQMLNTAPNVAERRDLDSVLQYLSDSNHFLCVGLELHEFYENIAISVYFLTKQMLRKQA